MPFNYRRRRKRRPRYKRKKRTFRRRRRRRNSKISIRRMGKTNTDAVMVKLLWQSQQFIDDSTTPFLSLRMNSSFDPTVLATTTQPVGFDQWGTMYSKYQVMGNRISVIAINNHQSVGFNFCVYPSNVQAIMTQYTTAATTKYATNRYVSPSTGGNPRVVITKYMTPRKIFGRQTGGDVLFSAETDENPELECFWHIRGVDTLPVHANVNLLWQVRMTYYVKFFNRIELVDA